MNKLLLSVTLAAASLFASAASAQVIYSATFATNPDQWGAYSWQNANGSINFASGYLSFSTTGSDKYVGSYGPSNLPSWDGGFVPINVTPAVVNGWSVTFEARASVPDGTNGLALELQANSPSDQYSFASSALTDTWQTFTFSGTTSINGTPNPANVVTIAFATGGANVGTVDVRNLTIAAIPEPSSFAALGGLAALGVVGLRRRRRA